MLVAYDLIDIEVKKDPVDAKKIFKYAKEMLDLVLGMNVKKMKD